MKTVELYARVRHAVLIEGLSEHAAAAAQILTASRFYAQSESGSIIVAGNNSIGVFAQSVGGGGGTVKPGGGATTGSRTEATA